jgi:hypothetical protein
VTETSAWSNAERGLAAMNPADAGFFPALVDERRIFPDLAGTTRDEALAEMSAALAETGAVSDGTELARRLIERERMGSTGLGGGLAIPHCKLHEIGDVVLAVGVSRRGIDFGAADGLPGPPPAGARPHLPRDPGPGRSGKGLRGRDGRRNRGRAEGCGGPPRRSGLRKRPVAGFRRIRAYPQKAPE